jgi:hypothetical protein
MKDRQRKNKHLNGTKLKALGDIVKMWEQNAAPAKEITDISCLLDKR